MTFNRHDVENRWPEYLYRELDDPEQAFMLQAIQADDEFSEEESQWREMMERFDKMASIERDLDVPPELVFRVKRQVSLYQDWNAQTWGQFRRWATAGVAACILATVITWAALQPFATIQGNDEYYKPLRDRVLSILYDRSILNYYREEGLIGEQESVKGLVQNPEKALQTKKEESSKIQKDPSL